MKFDPKTVLAWVKQRWLVLTAGVVGLVALPSGVVGSGLWADALQKDVQASVDADLREISSTTGASARLTYAVPAATPGGEAVELKAPPNPRLIEHFKTLRTRQAEELSKLVELALAFNRGERGVLVEGLFPEPAPAERLIKPRDFSRVYFGEAYPALLRRVRAGSPPDAEALAKELAQVRNDLLAKKIGGGETTDPNSIPPELLDELNKELTGLRLARYQRRAAELSFYADNATFRLPASPPESPSLRDCWDLQHQYWINADLLDAAARANAAGRDLGVPASVVKRIESIVIDRLPVASASPGADAAPPAPIESPDVTLDYAQSITGRQSGPGVPNGLYDVRSATVVVVLSTQRAPQFFDALAATNFMTVLDANFQRVDPAEDLKLGFYYGAEHVVRATLRVETIWMRDWTKDTMPADIRVGLGIPVPPPAEGQPTDGSPPPEAPPGGGGVGTG